MRSLFTTLSAFTLYGLSGFTLYAAETTGQIGVEVRAAAQVNWGLLNPLRGDKSPVAANLWGDRGQNGATGMLVRFKQGFSSPAHIHNISYRGIVIEGAMHNDDPGAAPLWLPPISFWTQPAGAEHITAANGQSNLIYLEIDSGPYLVQPAAQQFDNGEQPLNLHASNLVWLGPEHTRQLQGDSLAIAYLWGKQQPGALRGSLVKIAANTQVELNSQAKELRAVVIQGQLQYLHASAAVRLDVGSYFSSGGYYRHRFSTVQDSVIYLRSDEVVQLSDTTSHHNAAAYRETAAH